MEYQKSLKYKPEDFTIIKKTGDMRIPYTFRSKDDRIEANVFWEPRDVQMRGIIIDKRSGNIVANIMAGYPMAGGIGKPPEPEVFVKSLVRMLKQGEYKRLEKVI
jgi:hypothetical protein